MGQITLDQSHQVMATLAVNTDWEDVDFKTSGLQDFIVRNPKEAGRQFTSFLKNGGKVIGEQVTNEPSLLELVSTVVVPATTSKFVAKEKFIRDTGRKAKVKISHLGGNFTEWYLAGDGKTEDPISEQTLRYHKLRQSSMDGPIIAELGGEARAETTLTEVFSLMEKQSNGENGALLTDGYANIFYVRDSAGLLRTVGVYWSWSADGWLVYALSVGNPSRWNAGNQVFSLNSVLESSETLAPAQA